MVVENLRTQRTYITNEADVHSAVMQVYSMLSETGALPTIATEVATAVSELAMNIVKYAGTHGNILVSLQSDGRRYVEVVAEDKGRGITNIEQAMLDHYSTKGTLGVGLPGVKRMMDEFNIVSSPGHGTRVQAKKWLGEKKQPRHVFDDPYHATTDLIDGASESPSASHLGARLPPAQHKTHDYAVIGRPCFGEVVSGDGAIFHHLSNGALIGIIDVLGHGQEAHELARFCENWMPTHLSSDVAAVLQALHQELKGSRGAAISLAYVSKDEICIAGVGNTIVYLVSDQVTAVTAQPGIVGSNFPRLRPATLPIQNGDVVLLTTDGISEHLESAQLLARCRMPVKRIVNGLLHDYGKTFDDATCIAMRLQL